MIEINIIFLLVVGIFVGAAAGFLGSFMVLKRMALVGDAFTHVALPGLALGLMFNIDPMLGAFVALVLAALGIWYLEETSRIYPEALVGIFFTGALAVGILITPEPELLEALFGDIQNITAAEGVVAVAASLLVMGVAYLLSRKLVLGVISEELAKSIKISNRKVNLLYLLLVTAVVTLGIRFVGTLLMGALVIVPAVSARNISRSLGSYYLLSTLFGAASAALGVYLSSLYNLPSGPAVVLASLAFFGGTFLLNKAVKA
ncbi:MAG: metal ABC transporter permease [Patescibacteria group bacterium]